METVIGVLVIIGIIAAVKFAADRKKKAVDGAGYRRDGSGRGQER